MRIFLLTTMAGLFFCLHTWAQETKPGVEITRRQFQSKQVIPPSPEAAELGKYGNVPVSLFTGTPGVSIPLVELKGNFLSLPVSLSYNHAGFKPEEIAPWTGLGWALNAGGVITRSVMGDPDVDDNYYKTPSPLAAVPTDEYQKQLYYEQIRLHLTEAQPDVYYYNFMGHSGKFVISPDDQIIKKEKSYLKIIKDFAGAEADFVITDENGFQYEFRAKERTLMTPTDDEEGAPSPIPRDYISAWYLSKVISPNGLERIEFDYYSPTIPQSTLAPSSGPNSVTFTKSQIIKVKVTQLPWGGTEIEVDENGWVTAPLTSSFSYFQNPAVSIQKKFVKKAALIKNDILTGFIDFESDANTRVDLGDADFDGERTLKKVKLFSVTGSVNTLIKEFNMSYSYFGISQTEVPLNYRRLMLKTVQEMSPNSSLNAHKPAYSFSYNGETATMPQRYTSSVDHWGYYNGQTNTFGSLNTMIPSVQVNSIDWVTGLQGLGANRESYPEYSVLTTLSRINYPTGGYTTFEYEGNTGPTNNPVGGVRIRQIIDHSNTNQPATAKRYEYQKEDGSSSGNVTNYPNYVIPWTWENYDNCVATENAPRTVRSWNATISSSSTFGLGSIQGNHVVYNRVSEYLIDVNTNNTLGKTVYTYAVQGFNEIDDHIGNGDLLSQQVYSNTGKLLDETVNTYSYEDFTTEKLISRKLLGVTARSNASVLNRKIVNGVTTYAYFPQIMCSGEDPSFSPLYTVPSQSEHWHNEYLPQRKKLTTQTRKVYSSINNDYIVYTKQFTYGNTSHTYPTLIEEKDSKTNKIFTSIKYVADYTINCSPSPAVGSAAAAIKDMQDKNMMGIPVETLQYREDPGGGNRQYLSGEYVQHKSGLPEKIYYLQTSPMPSAVTPSEASCTSGTQIIYPGYRLVATMSYDAFMNLREESKTDDVPTTYFWGYNNRYPVAKVTGKNLSASLLSGINQSVLDNPASAAALQTELNKLRTLPQSLVTSQLYTPMVGMTLSTDQRGRNISYEYDALGRLTLVRDHDGNVLKKICYNYAGQPQDCGGFTIYSNALTTRSFTKNNCGTNGTGSTVTYTVPAGTYTASSQTAADALAQADADANGQAYANATGACTWTNQQQSAVFTRNNCGSNVTGGSMTYYVYAGTFTSTISLADANQQAINHINTNGQNYVNSNAPCSWTNQQQTRWFTRNNCGPSQTGTQVLYTIVAGTHTSTVSQADANLQAYNAATVAGQAYANANGDCYCYCSAQDQRCVDGVCEVGVKVYTTSVYNSSTSMWTCYYHYEFSDGSWSADYSEESYNPCYQP